MSYDALIKCGRVVTVDLLNGGPVREGITLYQRGALQLHRDAPVLVDHDDNQPVGLVRELAEWPDTDGVWVWARCTIDRPPSWLAKGTRASVAYASLARGGMGDWSWVHRGLVTELSILSPSVEPAEPRARVVLLERSTATPRAAPITRRRGDNPPAPHEGPPRITHDDRGELMPTGMPFFKQATRQ